MVFAGNIDMAVEPPVEVVGFPGAIGGSASQQLTLTNNSGGQLAYKIKYPGSSMAKLLPPGEVAVVTLTFRPLPGPPVAEREHV